MLELDKGRERIQYMICAMQGESGEGNFVGIWETQLDFKMRGRGKMTNLQGHDSNL